MSSPSGGSILMTSAPTSASSRAQYGPASMMEKSSTRTPSRGAVIVSNTCIPYLLSGQSKSPLRDQAALDFVGSDTDDPHQRMAQVLLEPAVVDRSRHLLGNRGAHAENFERCFTETLHQFSREHLAYRAIFGRCDSISRKFRAMHHELAT